MHVFINIFKLVEIEVYVIESSESERYFEHFQRRKQIWEDLKSSQKLTKILMDLETKFVQLQKEHKGVDGQIHMQMTFN